MQHISTTPFGRRPVTAGLLAARALAETTPADPVVDKWQIFDDLRTARRIFGLTDRDLAVLNALISFHPDRQLADGTPLIVYPSNATLSDRAHGMAESTLRRHLAALVGAGVVLRHDSPNGKRYAVRDGTGSVDRAFGFDLRPLLVRAPEIAARAAETRADAARLKAMREAITLRKRDAVKLALYAMEQSLPGDWQSLLDRSLVLHRVLRRKLDEADLVVLHDETKALWQDTQAAFDAVDNHTHNASTMPALCVSETDKMDGNDIRNGRGIQNSITDSFDSEPCLEKQRAAGGSAPLADDGSPEPKRHPADCSIPLTLVLKACPDIAPYGDGRIQRWRDLAVTAARVRPMMGISPPAWADACAVMGDDTAATVLACMLQRADAIRSPGGYLRSLTDKARAGAFSPGPMVMALLA